MRSINKSISGNWLDSGRMVAGLAICVLQDAGGGEVTVQGPKIGTDPSLRLSDGFKIREVAGNACFCCVNASVPGL